MSYSPKPMGIQDYAIAFGAAALSLMPNAGCGKDSLDQKVQAQATGLPISGTPRGGRVVAPQPVEPELGLDANKILPERFVSLLEKPIEEAYRELSRFGFSLPLRDEDGKVIGEVNENRIDSKGNEYIIEPIDIPDVPTMLGIREDLCVVGLRQGHNQRDAIRYVEFTFSYESAGSKNLGRAIAYLRGRIGEPTRENKEKGAIWTDQSGSMVKVTLEGQKLSLRLLQKQKF